MTIECCKNCIPPKRHIGCHSKCKEYLEEKEEFEKKKEFVKSTARPLISKYDFDKVINRRKK